VDAPQRQLPAHLGLDVTVMAAGAHRVNVQRATRAGGEARSVQEDARIVDETRAPFLLAVLVLPALRVDALLATGIAELPFVGAETLRDSHDVVAVLAVREVGAVRATALHHLRRALGEHALATAAEDALPRREEEGDVDLPAKAFFLGIVERHPLTGGTGHRAP